uniref:U2 snRNP-associated SURP motif-containing protein n=2 Tax=Cacopsylla melanoneura TaxID=428564 RepID=A0A8D8W3F9_9HEMI
MLIHRMVEFVVREGPMFEAMIMNKEISNSMYRFLFENQSPAHIYYRWKMYSLLQGDQPKEWRTNDFRMFEGGSVWRPPPMNLFTQGMSDELVEEELESKTKGTLSNSQRARLEDFLRNLTPERVKIAEAMVFCMEHSDAAEEICECIMESLSNETTLLHKKIARLYLVSDILHNCGIKITNASYYRRGFESRLFQIFTEMHTTFLRLESRLKAEGLRTRVMQVFRAWEDWAVYPKEFLIKLQNVFLGLSDALPLPGVNNGNGDDEDLDGAPLSDVDGEDLDGVPLDGAALMKSMSRLPGHATISAPDEDDIDGVPLDGEELDGVPMETAKVPSGRAATFVPSKWETVDESEDQAVTSSKWDDIERQVEKDIDSMGLISSRRGRDLSSERMQADSPEDDSISLDDREEDSDDRRAKLREVEVKVMQYQDELESGRKSLKSGWTMVQQVQHYRKKLIRKAAREEKKEVIKSERSERRKSPSPASPEYRDRDRDASRNRKRGRSRSNSRSPVRKSRKSRSASFSPPSKKRSPRSPPARSRDSRKHVRSPSPAPRHKRKHVSPSPPPPRHSSTSSKYSKSPPSSRSFKHSRHSPSPPPPPPPSRKHKHKHKY